MFVGSPTERRRFATFEFRAVWLNTRSPDSACHVMWHGGTGGVLINLYEVYKFVYTKPLGKKRENEKEKRDQYWHEFLYRAVFMLKPVFFLLMYLVFNAPCISFFYGVIYNFVVQFVLYSFSVIWSLCINFPLFLAKIFTYFFFLDIHCHISSITLICWLYKNFI